MICPLRVEKVQKKGLMAPDIINQQAWPAHLCTQMPGKGDELADISLICCAACRNGAHMPAAGHYDQRLMPNITCRKAHHQEHMPGERANSNLEKEKPIGTGCMCLCLCLRQAFAMLIVSAQPCLLWSIDLSCLRQATCLS